MKHQNLKVLRSAEVERPRIKNWQAAVGSLGAPNRWQMKSVVQPFDHRGPSLRERLVRWIQSLITND